MPLFTKKFEAKPIPPRMGRCHIGVPPVQEELDDFRNISLQVGSKELRFADGIWIQASRKSDADDVARMQRRIRSLEQENNMCQLKIEIFLDLLAEHATELEHLKQQQQQ